MAQGRRGGRLTATHRGMSSSVCARMTLLPQNGHHRLAAPMNCCLPCWAPWRSPEGSQSARPRSPIPTATSRSSPSAAGTSMVAIIAREAIAAPSPR